MWASFRAEVLVLRKSPVAWVLMCVAPAVLLVTVYGFGLLESNPELGNLPTLLPDQTVIQVTERFAYSGLAPFVVLGALMAGGDWHRGTIVTAVIQAPGRFATFAGQVLALVAACLISVLAAFAVSIVASGIIWVSAGKTLQSASPPFPPVDVLGRGIAFGLLISFVYGALGLALGTVLRSAAAAVAVALVWSVIIEPSLYGLGLYSGGLTDKLVNLLPQASAVSLNSTFGAVGGGAHTAMFIPVAPAFAIPILTAYLLAFLTITYVVLARRDIGSSASNFTSHRASRSMEAARHGKRVAVSSGRLGVLASYRAELIVLRRWPAIWVLTLLPAATVLIGPYLLQYVFYLHAGHGSIVRGAPAAVLPGLLPNQFVATTTTSLTPVVTGITATAAFFILGAFIAGRSWSDKTIATAAVQGPGRAATALAQALAVMTLLAISVIAMFGTAAIASEIIAAVAPSDGLIVGALLPPMSTIVAGLGVAFLISLAWGGAGMLLGTLFRDATAPAALLLLWSTFFQLPLNELATNLQGVPRDLYDALPDSGTTALTSLFNQPIDTNTMSLAVVAPAIAAVVLGIYAITGFGVPVLLTRARTLT